MAIIDKIRVNGTDYGISTGGEMPASVYFGTTNSGYPVFSNYDSPDDDEYLSLLEPSFYLRRRWGDHGYDYDLVALISDRDVDDDSQWVSAYPYGS